MSFTRSSNPSSPIACPVKCRSTFSDNTPLKGAAIQFASVPNIRANISSTLNMLSVLLIFALIFGTLANWIAAPFNGVLSEKVERHLTGQAMGDDGLLDLVKDIPRTLGREFTKLFWYIPRAIGFLILFIFVPVFGQILWFLFSAWMMAIQYCDYPYDNHKIDFKRMQNHLSQHKGKSMSFGIMVNIFSLIPVVNFIVMPVAICGATSMWVSELRDEALTNRV